MHRPLFRRRRGAAWRFAVLAVAVFGVALLAGCSVEYEGWPPADAAKSLQVGSALLRHDVAFVPGTATPSAGEIERLDAFLAGLDAAYGDAVFIEAPPQGPSNPSAAARQALVVRALAARGIEAIPVSAAATDLMAALDLPAGEDGRVSLRVRRHRVVLPDCPDWRKPTAADFSNTPSSNFGCATLVNLGLMAADPRDLKAGRSLSPAEAERAARAVEAYRKGEQPALPDQSKSTQSFGLFVPMGQQ